MLTARNIMTANPVTISPKADIAEAVRILLEKKFNGLPVVTDDGTLVGVICQSDLVAKQKELITPSYFTILDVVIPMSSLAEFNKDLKKITASTIQDAMTADCVTLTPDTPMDSIASIMAREKLYTLPVVEDGKLVGVVGKEDILQTLLSDGG